jgi:flagellar basal-body rod modification protein FlgD
MGITSTVTPVTYTGANNSATSTDNDLGPNAFLQLLTTEMENQDPDNPQDATESVTQLAQMSELQYQQELTSDFSSFQSNFGVLQAASLVGKTATVNYTSGTSSDSTSTTYTGTISGVQVEDGAPYFTMTNSSGATIEDSSGNPLLIPTSDITSIGGAATSGTTNSTNSSVRL